MKKNSIKGVNVLLHFWHPKSAEVVKHWQSPRIKIRESEKWCTAHLHTVANAKRIKRWVLWVDAFGCQKKQNDGLRAGRVEKEDKPTKELGKKGKEQLPDDGRESVQQCSWMRDKEKMKDKIMRTFKIEHKCLYVCVYVRQH